jgi:hypothetical protein
VQIIPHRLDPAPNLDGHCNQRQVAEVSHCRVKVEVVVLIGSVVQPVRHSECISPVHQLVVTQPGQPALIALPHHWVGGRSPSARSTTQQVSDLFAVNLLQGMNQVPLVLHGIFDFG